LLVLFLAGIVCRPTPASAHHEAIFGPQSSLVLSADKFVSVQIFSRELGASDAKTTETTTVASAGVPVSRTRPLTFTVAMPYSWISQAGYASRSGAEDIVLGLRYRHDVKSLQERWGREGNFVMGVGAFELNNGTIDHGAWKGPLDGMGAILGSLERGKWSAIGYSVMRLNAQDDEGNKDGNSLFFGGGLAYTPNEDFQSGRLISYQAGWSYEHYARDEVRGERDVNTGGDEILIHPTFVYAPRHDLLLFGMVSVPAWRNFRDPTAQDRFRFGTGLVYKW
jgi:hypothetical protein